jgi:hypothetical protein
MGYGYQLNGLRFETANFTKPIDFLAILIYSLHFGVTTAILYLNVKRNYISPWSTPVGIYVNGILSMSLIWQVILILYQYVEVPPIFAWLFGFIAAIVLGVSTIGQIQIQKSLLLPGSFLTVRKLSILQGLWLLLFASCLWPSFFLLPTLGTFPAEFYFNVYSVGYLVWAALNEIVTCICAVRVINQARNMIQLYRELGSKKDAGMRRNSIQRLSYFLKFMLIVVAICFFIWIFSWFVPIADLGTSMTLFLIGSALAESNVILLVAMFKLMSYHALKSKKETTGGEGFSQIKTEMDTFQVTSLK